VESERPGRAISVQCEFSEKLTQTTTRSSTVEFHLPQAILRVYESLGEEEIVDVLGVNMGNSPTIADNFDRIVKFWEGENAMGLG
jgi:hypothetical protein